MKSQKIREIMSRSNNTAQLALLLGALTLTGCASSTLYYHTLPVIGPDKNGNTALFPFDNPYYAERAKLDYRFRRLKPGFVNDARDFGH